MQLTSTQIEQLAKLARLKLAPTDQKKFTKQLGDILGYFEKLTQLDTQNIEPTSQSIDLKNVDRLDEIKDCLPEIQTAILNNTPDKSGNYIRVNKVL